MGASSKAKGGEGGEVGELLGDLGGGLGLERKKSGLQCGLVMTYKKHNYTLEQQRAAIIADLLSDAEHSEKQAIEGPFFPDITPESLRAYAAQCRKLAAANGWGVEEFISGEVFK
jgi:hypothetical protein